MINYKLKLNNKHESLNNTDPSESLLDWLRDKKKLTGTKEGCAEGDCGACSILITPINGGESIAANSCLLKLGQVIGSSITTIEGLGNSKKPNIVQKHISESAGSQCGFCTPGIIISLSGLINKQIKPSYDDIHDALAGNLCRCTGYKPLIEGTKNINYKSFNLIKDKKWKTFPTYEGPKTCFYYPNSINEALKIISKIKNLKIIAGGTDLNLSNVKENNFLQLNRIKVLSKIAIDKNNLVIGSCSTLEDILPIIDKKIPQLSKIIRRFGSTQIRSQATIAGNISTASPIGDFAPPLIALKAKIQIITLKGTKTIPIENFFIGYRQSILKNSEFISKIIVPLPEKNSHFFSWKISKRFDQDISTISMSAKLDFNNNVLKSCIISFGGMAAKPLRSREIENYFLKNFPIINFNEINNIINNKLNPLSDLRGSSEYRKLSSFGLLKRLFFALKNPKKQLEVFN